MTSTCRVAVVAFTDRGRLRDHHEDTLAVGRWVQSVPMVQPEIMLLALGSPLVCVVADGMGGHRAGEVASRHVACRIVEEAASLYDEDTLATCLRRLNDELFDEMSKHPGKSGMGATVAGIVIATSDALVFNVGDSRIYREQDGFLRQLSVDDRPMAPPGHRVSHRLTQALGGAAERTRVDPHISRERLSVGRRYLICSDGLSDSLDPDSMESCLVDDDAATVTTLFEKATERGGEDNISILLLRVDGGGSSASDAVGHEKRE